MRRDFETMFIKDFKFVDSFFTQVIGLVNQIRSHVEILEDKRIVENILKSLSAKFEYIVVAIEKPKQFQFFPSMNFMPL